MSSKLHKWYDLWLEPKHDVLLENNTYFDFSVQNRISMWSYGFSVRFLLTKSYYIFFIFCSVFLCGCNVSYHRQCSYYFFLSRGPNTLFKTEIDYWLKSKRTQQATLLNRWTTIEGFLAKKSEHFILLTDTQAIILNYNAKGYALTICHLY